MSKAATSHVRLAASSLPPRADTAPRPRPRPRPSATVAPSQPAERTRLEAFELRDLLEANLQALHALLVEHQRMIHAGLSTVSGDHVQLRNALLAIGNRQAPWVHAMEETRALLFVALRELIIGAHEAELSMPDLPQSA